MTLLVAAQAQDGLVCASDSRATFGDVRNVTAQNDSVRKAHILAPSVALLAAGTTDLASTIIREAHTNIAEGGFSQVTQIANCVRSTARNRYNEWFSTLPPVADVQLATNRPELIFIIAGYDSDADEAKPSIFSLYSAWDFAPFLHDYGFALGGVAQYALYLMNRLYQPARSVSEVTALAVYTITETASQDGKVGGPPQVITLHSGTPAVELDAEAIQNVIQQNDERAQALRNSFYEEPGLSGDGGSRPDADRSPG